MASSPDSDAPSPLKTSPADHHEPHEHPTDVYVALGTIRLSQSPQQDQSSDAQWLMVGPSRRSAYPNPLIVLGEHRQWIKTTFLSVPDCPTHARVKVYALPEDVTRTNRAAVKDLRRLLRLLADFLDTAPATWRGEHDPYSAIQTYKQPGRAVEESLFYIFNTLSSPQPSPDGAGDCPYSRRALADVFHGVFAGLRTPLYPYQTRSVAAMLHKEANPSKSIDPRSPDCRDLEGRQFFWDPIEGVLLREPYLYDEPRGGILAETMGYGKTLICIALILATRGHYPKITEGRLRVGDHPVHQRTLSLVDLAAKAIKLHGVPWKAHFASLRADGFEFDHCTAAIGKYDATFAEPIYLPRTPSRGGKQKEDCTLIHLCHATLVIVPPNLLVQWQHEIEKHTEVGALDVLVLDSTVKEIPHCKRLMQYDVVLITKNRFDQEYRDDEYDVYRRMFGRDRYRSPLTDVRWLRVICDEGHAFAGSSYRSNATAMLEKMSIERRWVVSGTPSHSLHGIEVNLAVDETPESPSTSRSNSIQAALKHRRLNDTATAELKDIERLRAIVVKFLRLQPWANPKGADHADWKTYLHPYDASGTRRFAPALRVILQSLIVRHRIEDIDLDLTLPPLHNTTTYLEPSYYDKLSMNLFRLVLTSNAVTSERTDEDYMFHPKNRKFLDDLINNLRHSSFHWVGFSTHDITQTVTVSSKYLDEHIDTVTDDDGRLLTEAIMNGERALADPGWLAFSFFHEIGVYIEDFPEHAAPLWALHGQDTSPLLMGTVQAREAQQYVSKRRALDDPGAELGGAGIRAMQAAKERATEEQQARNKSHSNATAQSPTAGAQEEPKVKRISMSSSTVASPLRPNSKTTLVDHTLPQKAPPAHESITPLPPHLAGTKIVGFTSAKLNYLCSRILALHQSEKIIVFYDSNNVAFWIAEALELLSVRFLIYANTLQVNRRAAYLATFNQSESFRVLLMDLKQASLGLHVASASRVFIVSPIWQPSVESQAIKRAHRIGQTRPVFVETLVLKGTLEEKILRRRRQMSNAELVHAEKSLLEDGTMNGIIRADDFLKFADGEERELRGGRLDVPVPLFDKSFTDKGLNAGPDKDLLIGLTGSTPAGINSEFSGRKRGGTDSSGKTADTDMVTIPSSWFMNAPNMAPEGFHGLPSADTDPKPKKRVRVAFESP